MFWFKTLQLQKASTVEIKYIKSGQADGFENLLASRDSCSLFQLAVSLLSYLGIPGSGRVTSDLLHQLVVGFILCSQSLVRALVLQG